MKRLDLKSLRWQTFIFSFIASLIVHIIGLILYHLLVLGPQVERIALLAIENKTTLTNIFSDATTNQKNQWLDQLSDQKFILVKPLDEISKFQISSPSMMDSLILEAIARNLGNKDVDKHTDAKNRVWFLFKIEDVTYGLSVTMGPRVGFLGTLFFTSTILIIVSLGMAILVSQHLSRPLESLSQAAQSFRLETHYQPINETGTTELASLIRSFNEMRARLIAQDSERNLLLAGISHDLRTPLAKLRLIHEILPGTDKDLIKSADKQITSIDLILGQFLEFARGFEAENLELIDINKLITSIIEDFDREEIKFNQSEQNIKALVRPLGLTRMIRNIIENAINYGDPPVIISLSKSMAQLSIELKDHGKGIDPNSFYNISKPFVRGDNSRGSNLNSNQPLAQAGTGLGLAIAEKVAMAHGGKIEFRHDPDGFAVLVTLAI